MSRLPESHSSILRSDFSATTLVALRDGASRTSKKMSGRKRNTVRFSDDPGISRWQRSSSFHNSLETDSAPSIPLRQGFCTGSSPLSSSEANPVRTTLWSRSGRGSSNESIGRTKTTQTAKVHSEGFDIMSIQESSLMSKFSVTPPNVTSVRRWENAINTIVQHQRKSDSSSAKRRRNRGAKVWNARDAIYRAIHVVSTSSKDNPAGQRM